MKNINKKSTLLVIFLMTLFMVGCSSNESGASINQVLSDTASQLIVHYIDVGQGDSIFIELPNRETMLIDAGEKEYGSKVTSYIEDQGYEKIDYVIGTHPHSDHVGGLGEVISNFDVENVYLPKASNNTNTYLNLLTTIKEKGLTVKTGKAGVNILTDDELKINIIAPNSDSYKDLNNYSIVIKINYKNRNFLFMGDAEKVSEDEITDDVDVNVIKVGHHGSDSSSSVDFVNKVSAKYAIISVGKDNKYKHPYQEILNRWENSGAKIYRTDELGTIVVRTDGDAIVINDKEVVDNKKEDTTSKEETADIILTSLTDKIEKGNNGTISIKGNPNTKYSIQVLYASGASSASGLEDKISDSEGNVSWTWKVASNTKTGTYSIIISDENIKQSFPFEIID